MTTFQIMAGESIQSVSLEPGVFTIGRSAGHSIVIDHPTVSDPHAEFTLWEDGQMCVRDLESANGTQVNGAVVTDAFLRPGDVFRLGEVIVRVQRSSAPMRVKPGMGQPVVQPAEESYWTAIGRAFIYPFKGDALLIIGVLAILTAICDFLPFPVGIIGLLTGLGLLVYGVQVFRDIILTTADGQDRMPDMPSLHMEWSDIRQYVIPIYALGLFSMLPMIFSAMIPGSPGWLSQAFGVAALLYIPMGLLLLVMTESFWQANPVNALRTVLKAPLGYVPAMLAFAGPSVMEFAFTALGGGRIASRFLNNAFGILWVVVNVCLTFVAARILGLYARHNAERFGWREQPSLPKPGPARART